MDQTFFIFLILFTIIIIYLFKQKQEQDKMKNELNEFVGQENFTNETDTVDVNEINLQNMVSNEPEEENHLDLNPEPMNKPNNPLPNGYSSTLTFNHPDKINGCDIENIAPMNYYKEMNQKLKKQLETKVMNGDAFGDVSGYSDETDEGYMYF